eukprot:CAMPEP_0185037556 /NCGR_PEP_ID=MMETSP1103-20130426/32166_1 /TAXON_ID=36769 /ORGANISM="Paraphysomonas bandaiensis, Strain Caron Lab Isolate" /LENGTH=1347 /DNA_ID=CAMNT_0027575597 /DNA_START=770 /DNA_END=4813 /DNA_ORIENTATION=-
MLFKCVDLSELSPEADPRCARSLMLQKLVLERLLGLCVVAGTLNFYKLSWAASLAGCFYTDCEYGMENNSVEGVIQSLSYWLPDFLAFLYWVVFLLNPLRVHLSNAARKTQSSEREESSIINPDSFVLESAYSSPVHSVEMSPTSNPLSLSQTSDHDIEAANSAIAPQSDLKRMSGQNKRASKLKVWLGGGKDNGRENETLSAEYVDQVSTQSTCRELHISCSELVLVDKRTGIPVPSMFSGRDTFVVMSMSVPSRPGKPKRSSKRVATRMVERLSARLSKKWTDGGSDKQEEDGGESWVEVARSDCRTCESHPKFIVSFIVPVFPPECNVSWRFDIYNASGVDSSFRADSALLSDQFLIGVAYIKNKQFYHTRGEVSSYLKDQQVNDGDVIPEERSGESDIVVDINVKELTSNFVRLGGRFRVRSNLIRPFTQLISELSAVNSVRQASRIAESGHMNVEDGSQFGRDVMIREFCIVTTGPQAANPPRDVHIGEEMVESPYTFDVPVAFMKCLLEERKSELKVLMEQFSIETIPKSYKGENWRMELLSLVQSNIESMRELVYVYESSTSTFKSSAKKKDKSLRFIPVNLHVHMLSMSGVESAVPDSLTSTYLCDFVTVGAFAAHSLKFKSGGLWHIMKSLDARLSSVSGGRIPIPENDIRLPDEIWNEGCLREIPLDKRLLGLAFKARERLDVCLSQCLSAVATGFVSRLQLMSPAAMERIATVGLLFQFESLLSTQGSELGMISDMYCTVKTLTRVHLKVHEERVATGPSIGRRRSTVGPEASVSIYWSHVDGYEDQCLIVDMGFISKWFESLPLVIREGKTIPVIPVMFSVGINELQSYAETVAGKRASALQDIINMENFQRMEKYCSLVLRLERGDFDNMKSMSDLSIDESEKILSMVPSFSVQSSGGHESLDIETASTESERPTEVDSKQQPELPLRQTLVDQLNSTYSTTIGQRRHAVLLTDTAQSLMSTHNKKRMSIVSSRRESDVSEVGRSSNSQSSKMNIWDPIDEDSDDDFDVESPYEGQRSILDSEVEVIETHFSGCHKSDITKQSPEDEDDDVDGLMAVDIERQINDKLNNISQNTKKTRSPSIAMFSMGAAPRADARESSSGKRPPKRRESWMETFFPNSNRKTLSPDLEKTLNEEDELDWDVELGIHGHVEHESSETPSVCNATCPQGNSSEVVTSFLADRLNTRESTLITVGAALQSPSNCLSFEGRVERLLCQLRHHVQKSVGAGGKPYQILTCAAKLTRALDGVRLTSCKSAKDRTGMSVTLEEASLVRDVYGLSSTETKDLLDILRVHGVRLENAKKNVGKARFAFNSIQRRFLPQVYAPPLSVIGNVSS